MISIILLLIFSNCLYSGEIRGKVMITEKQDTPVSISSRSIIRKYVTKADNYHEHAAKPSDTLAVVVYIADIQFETSGNKGIAVLDQRGQKFVPHVLPVLVGTEVRFPNSDVVYHNVFSYSKTRSFDLGRYPTGRSKSVIFDKPGVVKVYCDIHPDMNAFIIVLSNPYFTTTAPDGSFVLRDVPPGSYTLKAWYGRWPEKAVKIEVTDDKPVEINIDFP